MKKTAILLSLIICFAGRAAAQDVIKRAACYDEGIARQADSVKQELSKQGFVVVKEASMAMESGYEMAVLVPLAQGSLYQFVFIGDITSKLYEVSMYSPEEERVVHQKKLWGDVDGNIISFPFVPPASEFYNIRPVQENKKKKELCGYVMLLKKVK